MPKRSSTKRGPEDANQIAFRVAQEAVSSKKKQSKQKGTSSKKAEPIKNEAAVLLGRLGGLKGGRARADKLSPAERVKIAQNAAKARWSVSKDE